MGARRPWSARMAAMNTPTPDLHASEQPLPAEGYAGDVSPPLAWQWVRAGQAVLVDVRTDAERDWVGFVPGAVAAARRATELGITAYNILEGFEGEPDENGQRNRRSGWRFRGLPWRQG